MVCEGLLLGGPPASSPHSGSDAPGCFYIKPGWPDLGVFHWGPLSTAELAVCLLLNFLNSWISSEFPELLNFLTFLISPGSKQHHTLGCEYIKGKIIMDHDSLIRGLGSHVYLICFILTLWFDFSPVIPAVHHFIWDIKSLVILILPLWSDSWMEDVARGSWIVDRGS